MKTMFYVVCCWLGGAMMCFDSVILFLAGLMIFAIGAYKFGNALGINNVKD